MLSPGCRRRTRQCSRGCGKRNARLSSGVAVKRPDFRIAPQDDAGLAVPVLRPANLAAATRAASGRGRPPPRGQRPRGASGLSASDWSSPAGVTSRAACSRQQRQSHSRPASGAARSPAGLAIGAAAATPTGRWIVRHCPRLLRADVREVKRCQICHQFGCIRLQAACTRSVRFR